MEEQMGIVTQAIDSVDPSRMLGPSVLAGLPWRGQGGQSRRSNSSSSSTPCAGCEERDYCASWGGPCYGQ
eukprot:1015769-Alexandrium_andersonii.AAC.1